MGVGVEVIWASPQMVFHQSAQRFPASAGFCRGPGGQDTHPLGRGGSLVFLGSCLSLIPRVKSLSHLVWAASEKGKAEPRSLPYCINRGKERGRLLRVPACRYPAGPAGVLSAGGKKGTTKKKQAQPSVFLCRALASARTPSTPNLEANILE